MLSTPGKIGYIMAAGGAMILFMMLLTFFDGLVILSLLVSTVLLVVGIALLMRDSYAKSLRWKLLWVHPWSSFRGRLGFVFFISGVVCLQIFLKAIALYLVFSGGPLPSQSLLGALGLVQIVVGVFLMMTDRPKQPQPPIPSPQASSPQPPTPQSTPAE